MAQMPAIDAGVDSLGFASYSYPIWTPPGPAGLQPALTLSYNSAMVDNAILSLTQGGWLGFGWSLDSGYILRDTHGTSSVPGDDSYDLVLNGVSGKMLLGTDGKYHLTDRNFWKIELASDIWTLWDKAGNKYTFGKDSASRARFPRYGSIANGCPFSEYTWRWGLSEVENKYGQKLAYSYTEETKSVKINPCVPGEIKYVDTAQYPDKITYPHSRYRVSFSLETRSDYQTQWGSTSTKVLYYKKRLDKVNIQHDPNGTGSWTTARSYDLSYSDIFPGWVWNAGGKSFAVSAIQETGVGGLAKPAVTFSYADNMHLSGISNGMGGTVGYAYESQPWGEVSAEPDNYIFRTPEGACPGGWEGYVSCPDGNLVTRVGGAATKDIGDRVSPGTVYELWIKMTNRNAWSSHLKVELQYAGSGSRILVYDANVAGGATIESTSRHTVPANATELEWVVTASNFRIHNVETRQVLTRWRVAGKSLDGGGSDDGSTVTYEYDDPASNDGEHSEAIAADSSYSLAFRDFRGHAARREMGMADVAGNRLVTTTWYRQDDAMTGKPVGSLSMVERYHQAFDGAVCGNGWSCTGTPSTNQRVGGDNAILVSDPDGGWNTTLERTGSTLANGEGVVLQFRTGTIYSQKQMVLALESSNWGSSFNRFGIHLHTDGSVRATYCDGTVCDDSSYLLGGAALELETWYVLALVRDDDHGFWLRLWERDDPAGGSEFRLARSSSYPWRFRAWVNYGNLWIDEYSEGALDSLETIAYDENYSQNDNVVKSGLEGYTDLAIRWQPVVAERRLSFVSAFDGVSSFMSRSLYLGSGVNNAYLKTDQGNAQYGNMTRVEEVEWNGSAWQAYRATLSPVFPNPSSRYLVGLPGYANRYDCPGGACDYGIEDLLRSHVYIYDSNTYEYQPPTTGKLTWEREFVCFANSSDVCYQGYTPGYAKLLYQDQQASYDGYGNPVSFSAYSQYGDYNNRGTGVAHVTSMGYDPTYHTYLIWQR